MAEKITVKDAAAIMKTTPRFLQAALQQGKFEFGTAVKFKRWSYYINREKFMEWLKGETGETEGGK